MTRVPIFRGMTRPEQEHLASFAKSITVRKGETVYAAGQELSWLLVMHSGQLKISQIAVNGQEQILRTAGVGEVVGERAFITGHRPDHFATAVADSQMCVFDHDDLTNLFHRYPRIGERMLRTLSDRLSSVERMLAAVTSSDVGARVAAYLLDQPGRQRDDGVLVQLPMTKQDVAAYLGTTPETLSRRLAALSDARIIGLIGRRDIVIYDVDALDQAAMAR